MRAVLAIAMIIGWAGAGSPQVADPALVAPPASEAPAPPEAGRRCDITGSRCISVSSYVPDVCAQIDYAARDAGLDVHFFVRLLWQESRFDANAISPAGAQGIAQFMPGTARRRGLEDPFNPAEAIIASARYLSELEQMFGSLGLAAVAYNAGEDRAAAFLGGNDWLPAETEAYVSLITGLTAKDWREGAAPPDLRLDPVKPFRQACVSQARGRGIVAFRPPDGQARPWGAILYANARRSAVERRVSGLRRAGHLEGMEVSFVRRRMPAQPRPVHTAQIGADSRTAAASHCERLTARGVACIVLKNDL